MLRHRFSNMMSWQKKLQKRFPLKKFGKPITFFMVSFSQVFSLRFFFIPTLCMMKKKPWKGNFEVRTQLSNKIFENIFFHFSCKKLFLGEDFKRIWWNFFFKVFKKKSQKSGKMLVFVLDLEKIHNNANNNKYRENLLTIIFCVYSEIHNEKAPLK